MPYSNRKLFLGPWQAMGLILSCYLLVITTAACAPLEATATASGSGTPVAVQQITPTVSPWPTATTVIASTSDVIRLPPPTAQPVLSPPGNTTSNDTLDLDTLTFGSPLASPSPTVLPSRMTPRPKPTPVPGMVSPLRSPTIPQSPAVDLAVLESEMIKAVNAERQTEGLPPYQVDELLSAVARSHARDTARRDYMSHVTPEGKTYTDRLEERGITSQWRGENIALSVRPAEEAVEVTLAGWLSDAPHRRNVLHPHHTHIGVGVAQTPEGWYVFVMDLIKP